MHLPWRDVPVPGLPGLLIYTSLTADEATELARLAPGRRVLEIGSAYGYSAMAMIAGGAESITSVDPHNWCSPPTLPALRENLVAYNCTAQVRIIQDTFFKAAAGLNQEGSKFDLTFIDGDHSFATVHYDFRTALWLLKRPGVIACHDYGESCCCPDVKRALDELVPDGPSYIVDTMAVYEIPVPEAV